MQDEQIIRLLTEIKESLEREIHVVRDELRATNVRLDAQAARMDRHAAWVSNGMRWSTRMTDWSERHDQMMENAAAQLAALTERIARLEGSKQ